MERKSTGIALEKLLLLLEREDLPLGASEFFGKQVVDAVAQTGVGNERGIDARDRKVGFRHGEFDVAQHVEEHRELGKHLA